MSIFWNGAEVNTLMYNGVETTGVYNGNIVWGNNTQQAKTLTLYHSEGGSLTADTLTGYPGDSVNLTTAYDTYWRFSGYEVTGDGTLSNNTYTFGTEDASICACYKVNAFTASGGFEKGSDVVCTAVGKNATKSVNVQKYAITGYRTLNVPADWYSNSNRWNPSNASAYQITLNPKMTCTVKSPSNCYNTATIKFSTIVNTTHSNTQSNTWNGSINVTSNYSKSFTSNVQSDYSISANLYKKNGNYARDDRAEYVCTATYIASNTTGTWTATGYAP